MVSILGPTTYGVHDIQIDHLLLHAKHLPADYSAILLIPRNFAPLISYECHHLFDFDLDLRRSVETFSSSSDSTYPYDTEQGI